MNHPLDGARFKVVWADEHLKSLKIHIGRYLDEGKYEVVLKKYADGKKQPHPVATEEPPTAIRAIIGDVLNNCRSALDYVMWELVSKYFTPAFNEKSWSDKRLSTFWISNSDTDKRHIERLDSLARRGIPTSVIDVIKAVQPYNAGQPLWWLHQLGNSDKHRMPTLTVTEFGNFMWAQVGNMVLLPSFSHHLSTESDPAHGGMKMQGQNPVYVAFVDPTMPDEPLDRTLEEIIKTVADVIPRFDRFFP